MNIDGIEVKVLMQHYQKLGRSVGPPAGPSTLRGPKQVHSMYLSRRNLKSQKAKTAMKNLTWNHLGQ